MSEQPQPPPSSSPQTPLPKEPQHPQATAQPIKPPTGDEALNAVTLKNPEDIYDLDNLPDDLKWIITHFNLPLYDPLVVMLAWHAVHIHNCRDVIQSATFELKANLDSRVKKIEAEAEILNTLTDATMLLRDTLTEKPLAIAQRLEEELKAPVDAATKSCVQLSAQLTATVQQTTETLKTITEQRLRIHLGIGFAAGCVFTAWIFCLFYC